MSNRTDNFTRANSSSTINPPSDAGSNWIAEVGTWGINSNQAYNPTADSGALVVLDSGSSDMTVSATTNNWVTQGISEIDVIAREADSNNYILFRGTGGGSGFDCYKKVAGTFTALFTGLRNDLVADNIVLKITCSGSSVSCFVGSTQVGATQTVTDGQTNTRHGLRAGADINCRWSAFSITDAGPAFPTVTWKVQPGTITTPSTAHTWSVGP